MCLPDGRRIRLSRSILEEVQRYADAASIIAKKETFKLMASGNVKNLSPDKYYFRINPIFETTSPKYDWLNHTVAIGVGTRTETGVNYKIYAIK